MEKYTQSPKYKVTEDGMFLIRLKDEKKIPIPSPLKLCNYGGLRTQLDIGADGKTKAIRRSVIDESDFSLGDPPITNGKAAAAKKTNHRRSATKVGKAIAAAPAPANADLKGAYVFYRAELKSLEEKALQVKQILNRLAFDMQESLPFPEQ